MAILSKTKGAFSHMLIARIFIGPVPEGPIMLRLLKRHDHKGKLAMKEMIDYWRHPGFSDLGMLKASFCDHRYQLHTHPTYVLALVTHGCERARILNKCVVAPPGTIILVNPEECHDGEAATEAGWAYRTLYPTVEMMESVVQELGQAAAPVFSQHIIEDKELAGCLLTAHESSRSWDKLSAEQNMLEMLRSLIVRYASNVKSDKYFASDASDRVRLYKRQIEENLSLEFNLSIFADEAGVSKFQVIRDFKNATGLTPAAFVRNRKLRCATILIEQGMSLTEAALEAGFFDQSHLSRVFRRVHGIPPGEYQAAVRTQFSLSKVLS